MAAMTRAAAKNNPVPRQREPGTTVFKMFLRSGFFLPQNTRSAAYAAFLAPEYKKCCVCSGNCKTKASDPKSADKQIADIFHMSDFTGIKKFHMLTAECCENMEVCTVSAKVRHHLIGYDEKVLHRHRRKVIENLVFCIFRFEISRSPIYNCFNGRDQKY